MRVVHSRPRSSVTRSGLPNTTSIVVLLFFFSAQGARYAKGTPERERADGLNRLERALFGRWMQWLTSGWMDGKDGGRGGAGGNVFVVFSCCLPPPSVV